MKNQTEHKKDYINAGIIGFFFGLFSIPIIGNFKSLLPPFIELNLGVYSLIVIFFTALAIAAIWVAIIVGKKIPVIFEIAKFAAVGAFNTFLDLGVLSLLMAITGAATGWAYTAFKGISFLTATMGSYFWNKRWTFKSEDETTGKEVGSFLVVSIIGALINMSVASLVVWVAPFDLPEKVIGVMGGLTATVASLAWNFVGYKFVVFKKK